MDRSRRRRTLTKNCSLSVRRVMGGRPSSPCAANVQAGEPAACRCAGGYGTTVVRSARVTEAQGKPGNDSSTSHWQ